MKLKIFLSRCTIVLFILFTVLLIAPLNVKAEQENNDYFLNTVTQKKEIVKEIVELRDSNVEHFLLSDGSYDAVVYSEPIHSKNKDGEWIEINNTMSLDSASCHYISKDNRISFNSILNAENNEIFVLNENGCSIGLLLNNIDEANFKAIVENGSTKNLINNLEDQSGNNKVFSSSNLKYESSNEPYLLNYQLSLGEIKEDIVVLSKMDNYLFSFDYLLENLYIERDGYNNLLLRFNDTKEVKYIVPAPYMYDSTGNCSNNIDYKIYKKTDEIYNITIIPNEGWIKSDERKFPITIDPSLRSENSCQDNYTDAGNPNQNFGGSSQLFLSCINTSYIKFNMPTLSTGAEVTSANLCTAFYYNAGVNTGYCNIEAHKCNNSWLEYGQTWNIASNLTNYGYDSSVISSSILSAEINATQSSPKYTTFDITSVVSSWYDDSSNNHGIALKYQGGTNNSVIIRSKEAGSPNINYISFVYVYSSAQVLENGIYWIENLGPTGLSGNRRIIDIEENSANEGTEVQQLDSPDPTLSKKRAQLFKLKYVNNGYYRIYTFSNPNFALKYDGEDGINIGNPINNIQNSLWLIEGNNSSGYTITNLMGANYSITTQSRTTNGLPLVFSSKNVSNNGRNRWNFNRFNGYTLSVISCYTQGEDTGHAFLMLENNSSYPITLGYITVMPEQIVSFGSCGGGSFASWGLGESFLGIYYDREEYLFYSRADEGYYTNRSSISIPIDGGDLNTINQNYLQNSIYNRWTPLKNCVYFATIIWNTISDYDISSTDFFGIYKPKNAKDSINTYSWHTNDIFLPQPGWYGYCNNTNNNSYFIYVQGTSGAYPTVPLG